MKLLTYLKKHIRKYISDKCLFDFPKLVKNNGIYYKAGEDIPFTGKYERRTGNSKIIFSGQFKNGLRNGEWFSWDINGVLQEILLFKNSNTEYIITKYYKNGNKALEVSIKDNKPNGNFIEWHKNGNKLSQCCYKNGMQVGKIEHWDADGNLSLVGFYNDKGKKDGEWMYKDKDTLIHCLYENDKLIDLSPDHQ